MGAKPRYTLIAYWVPVIYAHPMTPKHTLDALRDAADVVKRAEDRLEARRHDRDVLLRQALADGHAVALIARTTRLSRAGVRKIGEGGDS